MAKRHIIVLLAMLAMVAFSPFAMTRQAWAADITYFATSSDGYMSVEGTVYATEWANTTADTVDSTHADGNDLYIGQKKVSSVFETLLPVANSTDTEWDSTCDQPSCGACPPCTWGDRWEVVSDSDSSTWLMESWDTENGDWDTDIFEIGDLSMSEDTAILKLQVYNIMQRGSGSSPYSKGRTVIETHGTTYYGDEETLSTSWQNVSTEYTTNPYTLAAWTVEEINDIIAGTDCNMPDITSGSPMCREVYLRVYYDTCTIWKTAVYIDTSALDPDTEITSADLKLYVGTDNTTTDFDIVIQNGMPTYPHDPLVAADFDRTLYSGNGGSYDTSSGMSSWITIPLSADGLAWINAGGTTKFILRSDHDISGIAPTGNEYASFHSQEYGNAPKLEVTFTTPDPPYSLTCESVSSSQIDLTWVTGAGSSHTGVYAKVGSYPADRTDGVQIYYGAAEAYSYEGLSPGEDYYFRAWGYNTQTTAWSSTYSETYCTTLGGTPSYLLAIPLSSSQIGLTWTRGEEYTGIYYKLGGYPEIREDGTQVYYGTGESCTHSGLDPGTTYYYRAWGYDPILEHWSATYDQDLATTLLGEGGGPDAPPMPEEWFQDPSCSAYESAPGYSLLMELADSMSMPFGTMCLISTVFLVVGASAVGLVLGGTMIGLGAMAVGILAASIAGLLPMWFLLVALVLGISLAFAWTRA